jgi:putative endopeptidase
MKFRNLFFVSTTCIFLLFSCNNKVENQNLLSDPLSNHLDSSINVGDNFWKFANNGWFSKHPIVASENSNGIFRTIQDTINSQVLQICQKSMNEKADAGSNKQKIGDLYFSGMDTLNIDKKGLSPLADELKKIDDIKSLNDFAGVIAHLQTIGVEVGFSYGVGRDDKISSKYAIQLWQGGLGLPERDYYFENDGRTKMIREEYLKYVTNILEYSVVNDNDKYKGGTDGYKRDALKIIALETALARSSRKLEALRDPYMNYNKMAIAKVNAMTPSFNWTDFATSFGLKNVDTMILGQPEFVSTFEKTLHQFPIDVWKNYFKFHLLNEYAPYLSSNFEKENFHFFSQIFGGVKEQKPRWKRVVETTDGLLGELIGQVYVKEYLPTGAKEKITEIGKAVANVYADHIKALDWMSDSTKQKALYKLSKITMKMGYPDKWKDMSNLTIDRNSYAKNVMACSIWQHQYNTNKYGKPVDRTEWNMTPQTYNAYYEPTNNEIVIPACNIIVPGFEGRMPDDAVLYGVIGGSTIGHEITHGFDDQGSQYDPEGNLRNWWSKEDKAKFDKKTKQIIAQFNGYKVLDSLKINGEATQGENIADLGGVVMGYEAFKKTAQGKGNEKIGGLTPDQRYFLSYAYSWMVQMRPESMARRIKTDVHSPAEYRVNGPLSNNENFYKAFNIQPNQFMYRSDSLRVKIW